MKLLHKCCFCNKIYEYYEMLDENPKFSYEDERQAKIKKIEYKEERGNSVRANAIQLKFIDLERENDHETKFDISNGEYEGILNICPDCMRKILDNLHPFEDNENIWEVV